MTDAIRASQPSSANPQSTAGPRADSADIHQVSECPAGRWWVCALLGAVMLAGGAFVLSNVMLASLVTALFFAAALIVSGGFEIAHAFYARGWKSVTLSVLIGLLFVGGGILLAMDPLATSLGLTLGIAAIMLVSGVMRVWVAFRNWRDFGWLLLISGLLGITLGVVLILGFPWTGLVVPGMLLGIDLLFNGSWWLTLGLFVRRPREGSMLAQPAAVAG